MKKDKEWAFIELGKLFPNYTETHNYSDNIMNMKLELLNEVYDILTQLDEPEVLSKGWIDEHSNGPSRSQYVWVDDLKELLVPKQEEVKRAQIPEWIIEWYRGANNEFSTLEDVFSNLSHDTNYNIMDSEKFRSRIMEYGGFSKMYEALSHIYFGVYEIEEEPKFYVLDKEDRPLLLKFSQGIMRAPSGLSPIDKIVESQRVSMQFTEQEIKDYDEKYLAFKVPVEGAQNENP